MIKYQTKFPDNHRLYRSLAAWIGTFLIVIGMLGLGLDAYWAASAIRFLTGLPGGGVLVAIVPFLPILLIAIGAYLVFLSKPRPIRPAEDEVKNGRG